MTTPDPTGAVAFSWPEPHIALATLTRAAEMNTLTLELLDALDRSVDEAFNRGARVMIITGSGRAFCCGAHLRYFTDPASPIGATGLAVRDNYLARIARLFDKLEAMPFPVIAAINGFALGGGCELALSCDFRIMASDAVIGLPETRIGATPGAGGVQKLQRYVGRGKALEWILLGSHLQAEEAEDSGLLFARTAAEDLMPTALDLARRIVGLAPNALAQAKMSLHVSGDVDLRTARRYGLEALALLVGQVEWREGMTAFAEKRAPDFSGPGDWGR